jgi:hypothetical protein
MAMQNLPELGTAISDLIEPTFALYEPLLRQRKDIIKTFARETFAYGEHTRQKLDVYYPTKHQWPGKRRPVLVYIYGGGFIIGDKILPGYADGTIYANIGEFFASKLGFIVVIPDYRLVSQGGRFPSGGHDLALAVEWIRGAFAQRMGYQAIDLFLMGNSAGGVNLATYLFADELAQQRQKITEGSVDGLGTKLRAVLFVSVPFHFRQAPDERKSGLEAYYGSKEFDKYSPFGLLLSGSRSLGELSVSGVACSVWTGTVRECIMCQAPGIS